MTPHCILLFMKKYNSICLTNAYINEHIDNHISKTNCGSRPEFIMQVISEWEELHAKDV